MSGERRVIKKEVYVRRLDTHAHTLPVGLKSVIMMKCLESGRGAIRQTDVRDGGSENQTVFCQEDVQ